MPMDSRQNLRCKPFPWPSHIGLKSIYPSSPPFMEGFFFPIEADCAIPRINPWLLALEHARHGENSLYKAGWVWLNRWDEN